MQTAQKQSDMPHFVPFFVNGHLWEYKELFMDELPHMLKQVYFVDRCDDEVDELELWFELQKKPFMESPAVTENSYHLRSHHVILTLRGPRDYESEYPQGNDTESS